MLPTEPKHLPRALLSIEDVEAILRRGRSRPRVTGLRDRAMLEAALLARACAAPSLRACRRYDVDLNRVSSCSCARARAARIASFRLGERAGLVARQISGREPPAARRRHEYEALFVTDYGEPVTPDYLASQRAPATWSEAGIDKPGSCHLFRHACATHMLDNGADIRFIQAMLGHATLSTTERYTHVAIAKLQQIHAATHPAQLARRQVHNRSCS